jgi:hypothetical protein
MREEGRTRKPRLLLSSAACWRAEVDITEQADFSFLLAFFPDGR